MKKTIRKLFNLFNIEISRKHRKQLDKEIIIKVGDFNISINSSNGLVYCYKYEKEYGKQLTRLTNFMANIFDNMSVIDVGANIGDSVSLIKSGADVPVICIEGDDKILTLFKKNTTQFTNIELIKTFLSDKLEEINFTIEKAGHNGTLVQNQTDLNSQTISLQTLDKIYTKPNIFDNVKIIKIDTEGFDLKIIRGGVKFLTEIQPVLFFEFNREALKPIEKNAFEIFQWLQNIGYDTILFYECDGRFMFSSSLNETAFLKQVYDYVDGENANVYYLDICVFHSNDKQIAERFIKLEEIYRLK